MKPIIFEVTHRAEDKYRTTITLTPTEVDEPFTHVEQIVFRIQKFQPTGEQTTSRDVTKPYPRSEVWDDWVLGAKLELKPL